MEFYNCIICMLDIIVVAICVVDISGATRMKFGTIKLVTSPCIDRSAIGYAHVYSYYSYHQHDWNGFNAVNQMNNSYNNPGMRNQNYPRNINHFDNHNNHNNPNSYNYYSSSNSGYHGKLRTLHQYGKSNPNNSGNLGYLSERPVGYMYIHGGNNGDDMQRDYLTHHSNCDTVSPNKRSLRSVYSSRVSSHMSMIHYRGDNGGNGI